MVALGWVSLQREVWHRDAGDTWSPQGRGRKPPPSLRTSRGNMAPPTPRAIPPPELWENKFPLSSAPLFTEVCYGGPRNPRVCAPEPTCNTSPPPAMQGSKVCLLAPGACRRVLLALGFASEWSSTSGEQWNPRRRPRGSRRSRLDTGPGPNRGHRGRQGWQARSLLGSVMLSDFSILEPSELSELGGRQ